ncbi:hypothetical protein MCOR27_008377 [Pyricularia oryzae]|uniref:Transcriptional activator n=4 Tax=Pyricularia TaxID=48558 RepID=G5EHR5_PYRO7|nr:uncharacterized protein MGG_02996 [Pyricularia oryzae 70-15]ELQ41542.1 hypothetical protein OOU_Y34scaffold00275g59 [Pyricularia oryzae Y34]KAH8838561.1 hypothetical protein MCOR01_009994 [Pyricularia oryzae]KAI6289733.1 hypothetical protein MCOR33_011735 [Pyricularia grisea]EAQ71370.1 hypothetical protein MGCH7_ch7g777 [Pyricularia oryzae 70-15]EHA45953.1 hypothetical protein MGG_02996 [Pyricularia oryzae 70-15]
MSEPPHRFDEFPDTGKARVIVAPENADKMETLAHVVLDDLLHNIISDLLLKVHRDEKMARAATAAIKVEKLAASSADTLLSDISPDVRVETEAAVYEDGKVLLKGNPLKTTKDILCERCHLPRLLYPTDGKGARKPDPGVIYCKKHPYIEKPNHDIYGQTWVPQGPGRGKKKKDMEKKLESSPAPGEDGAPVKTGAAARPPNQLSFPSATCSKCKRCILVTRLNNHMGSCIGNSGRNASRAAAEKMKNGGDGNGTPPSSQKGTPLPGSRASSPRKRDSDEMNAGGTGDDAASNHDAEGDDDTTTAPKKKKPKPSPAIAAAVPKKVILKTKGPKKEKVKTGSMLGNEFKLEDDTKPEKEKDGNSQPKQTQVPAPTIPPPSGASATPVIPPKKKLSTTKIPSPAKKLKPSNGLKQSPAPPVVPKPTVKVKDADAGSESSGTMSSPPPK